MFKSIKNLFEQKGKAESSFIYLCECEITKEAGGRDWCPRCGDKMRKKKRFAISHHTLAVSNGNDDDKRHFMFWPENHLNGIRARIFYL